GERGESVRLDREAEMIEVLAPSRCSKEVDHRRRVDTDRREKHLAAPPLVDPFGNEAQLVAIERERSRDNRGPQHDMIKAPDLHSRRFSRSLRLRPWAARA